MSPWSVAETAAGWPALAGLLNLRYDARTNTFDDRDADMTEGLIAFELLPVTVLAGEKADPIHESIPEPTR